MLSCTKLLVIRCFYPRSQWCVVLLFFCLTLFFFIFFFFFKQKTAYEIGTGDWSSDVCSSDLHDGIDHAYQYHIQFHHVVIDNVVVGMIL